MSSLVGLHQLLDAVSLAEDAGDHSKAVRLIRRWLDGAALEMCGPSLEVQCWHGELSDKVANMLTRIESLQRGAFSRANERLSDDFFAMSVEETVHENWKKNIVRVHMLFQDKMAALRRAQLAEAGQPPPHPPHTDDSVLAEDIIAIELAHSRQREQELQDVLRALELSAREEQEQREKRALEDSAQAKQPTAVQAVAVEAVPQRRRGRTGRRRGRKGRACCWCCGRAGQARDDVLTATLIDCAADEPR